MANPIQHAETTLTRVHAHVQPYMADLFYRVANNYLLLLAAVFVTNMIGIPLLLRFVPIPLSTVNIIGFSAMLLILVYGWRYLENRNHATALFVLYIRYSRAKRDLEASLVLAKEGVLENDDTLYIQVDFLEETATGLLDAVEEQGLKAHSS
ncbi:MAG: hypothetical protein WBC91_09300 [Phototrophicaceae bacterium]